MIKIAPSILSADFAALGDAVEMLEKNGADMIHLDVMDGCFVPNITFGPATVAALSKRTQLPLDVHLMIEKPERFIKAFAEAGAGGITIHAEASKNMQKTLDDIRALGVKPAVSINPETPLSLIESVLSQVDMVLLMSVHPGFGGQTFITDSVQKARNLRQMLIAKQLEHVDIQMDGGINAQNAQEVIDAGVTVIVAGSAVFKEDDPKEVILALRGNTI